MYHYSVTQSLHNPKLLHPMFQGKRPWVASVGAVILMLAVVLVVYVPGWVDSLTYGDVEHTSLVMEIDDPEELNNQPDRYPKTWDVEQGFYEIQKSFQVSFRNCTLQELVYNQEYSDGLRQALEEAYGDSTAFVVTGCFTTGDKQVPEGLKPNTTYENYQWVLGVARGKMIAHGLELFSQ
ncbi:MAG: hypothetical protein ACOYJZ_00405 [Acutalibacter sp.]|jgi:hypothetical protein